MADYATLLRDHVTLQYRSIDRIFLAGVCAQTPGGGAGLDLLTRISKTGSRRRFGTTWRGPASVTASGGNDGVAIGCMERWDCSPSTALRTNRSTGTPGSPDKAS